MLYILAIKNKRSPLQVIMNHYYNKLYLFGLLSFCLSYLKKVTSKTQL